MSNPLPVHSLVTEVTYSLLPPDDPNFDTYSLRVTWRGGGKFAVMMRGWRLSRGGKWTLEPIPSSRTEAWIRRHSFTFDEACARAAKLASTVTVNGRTAVEAASLGGAR